MKILVVADRVVHPPRSAAQQRVCGLLRGLSRQHEVVLFAPTRFPADAEGIRHLESQGIAVETVRVPARRSLFAAVQARIAALPGPYPANWVMTADPAVRSALSAVVAARRPDLVLVEHLVCCKYYAAFAGARPLVLDEYDVVSDREQAVARGRGLSPYALFCRWETRKVRAFEREMFANMDLVLACSELDRERFRQLGFPARVAVVPNGTDLDAREVAPASARQSVVFCGVLDTPPNELAARELARELLPRVRAAVPGACAIIVGRSPTRRVRRLAGPNVRVEADVPDVAPYLRDAGVVVVPVRSGSGTRVKILDAMAMGKAVVSTSKGAEGLEVTDGKDIFLRDDVQELAAAIVRLLGSAELRAEIGGNARRTVEARYDMRTIASKLDHELRALVASG